MMALDPQHITALWDAILDKARALKLFPGGISGAETDNPPGQGPAVALILGPLTPLPHASGLAETSCRQEFTVRITMPRTTKTPEEVDRALLYASVTLIGAFSGDFALTNVPNNLVRNIDLLGAYGPATGMRPGWLAEGEVRYRVADIPLGIILNDTFAQAV